MKDPHSVLSFPVDRPRFAELLVNWYRREQRELPWRSDPKPYHVWLSEIMLQQTRVSAALPYYQRFLNAYPTMQALAASNEKDVLALWSGLGYYNRARNLRRAAQQVCDQHGGEFPRSLEEALQLPGIGRYTAGAILSIAYRQPLPILDGNIRRLLTRYLLLESPPAQADRQLWEVLSELVEEPVIAEMVREFNQALMELGALVCTPRKPNCTACPLQGSCRARIQDAVERLPLPRPTPRTESLQYVSAVILRDGACLLVQNRQCPFLKDFWDFPKLEGLPGPGLEERFSRDLGLHLRMLKQTTPVTHQITFRRLKFFPMVCTLTSELPPGNWIWNPLSRPSVPVSSYVRKIARSVAAG